MSELFHNEAGEPVGYVHQADDGAMVLIGFEGQILGAASADGQALDPNDYTFAGQDDGMADRIGQLEQQAAANEHYLREQQRLQQLGPVDQADAELTWHRMQEDVANQADSFEARIGRKLTQREQYRLAEVLGNHANAGRDVDIVHAAQQLEQEGFAFHSKDNHDDRVKLAVERLADRDREQRGVTIDEAPVAREQGYDRSKHEDRVALAMDKLAGADTTGRDYDSRDPVTED